MVESVSESTPLGPWTAALPPPSEPPATIGHVVGVVWDLATSSTPSSGTRVMGATVGVGGAGSKAVRSGDAYWSFDLAPGSYTLTASAPGYQTASAAVQIAANQTTWASMGLLPAAPSNEVSVAITAASGAPLAGAIVYVPSEGVFVADEGGRVSFTLDAASVEARVFRDGYTMAARTLSAGESAMVALSPLSAPPQTGKIQGVVWDLSRASSAAGSGSARLPGAYVLCSCGRTARARAGDGYWKMDVAPGSHTFVVVQPGFQSHELVHSVPLGGSEWASIGLLPE